jgi:hypothetical protein
LWILWKERVKQILEEREEKFLDVEDQVRKEQTAIYAEDIGNGF